MASLNTLARVALCRTPVGDALRRIPGLERAYARRMLASRNKPGLFAGCHPTHGEAMAAIPAGRLSGWDNADCAAIFTDALPDQPSAHAVFFWLSQLLQDGTRLVDYGGGPAVTYRQYRRRAALPPNLSWTVVDLPAIVARGREIAALGGLDGVRFTETLAQAGPCDILLSAGALQTLSRYAFPGNVRELENLLHRALALAGGERINTEDLGLPDDLLDESRSESQFGALETPVAAEPSVEGLSLPEQLPADLARYLDEVERAILLRALELHRFNRTAAAASLGLSLRQIRYRMARLAISAADA